MIDSIISRLSEFGRVSSSFILLSLSVVSADALNAQSITIIDGELERYPSLKECMKAAENGNILIEKDANSSVVIAYKDKIYFIKPSPRAMSCAAFKPTHERKN